MDEKEDRIQIAARLMGIAKDQIFIRGTVDEDESSYDLSYTGKRTVDLSACVIGDDSMYLCEVPYRLSEPITDPSKLDNFVPPAFWCRPGDYFRDMDHSHRGLPMWQAFTDIKPVVIWHYQRNRCLSPSDPVLLQHYARLQTGLAPFTRQGDHGQSDQVILELFFHRLSCFITTQNRRRREVDGI